jgi:hypothetical protein
MCESISSSGVVAGVSVTSGALPLGKKLLNHVSPPANLYANPDGGRESFNHQPVINGSGCDVQPRAELLLANKRLDSSGEGDFELFGQGFLLFEVAENGQVRYECKNAPRFSGLFNRVSLPPPS